MELVGEMSVEPMVMVPVLREARRLPIKSRRNVMSAAAIAIAAAVDSYASSPIHSFWNMTKPWKRRCYLSACPFVAKPLLGNLR